MFVRINKNLLNKSLKKAGIIDQIQIQETIKKFKKYIISEFGKNFLNYILNIYIKNNFLVIKADNSLVTEKLKQNEQKILDHLNQNNKKKLKRIRFTV